MRAVVYTGTRNVYKDMVPAVKSLIANANVDKIYLLIEDDTFPYEMPPMVETRNISNQTYFRPDGPNFKGRWTYMVLVRAAFSKLFPDLDTILSLDIDTIVLRDISDLWDLPIPMDDFYVAGCREPQKSVGKLYYNCGVMLLNLKKLRDDSMDERLIRLLNEKQYPFCEQDCMNEQFQGHILKLSPEYNVNHFTEKSDIVRIAHYAAVPNWQENALVGLYRNMDWKEVMRRREKTLSAETG